MNQITISGNLTRDPEIRFTSQNEPVTNFTVAVNENDKTIFLNCVAFKKLAENCGKYLAKGSKVLVNGRLSINEYETDDKHYKTPEIIAFQVEFLNRREEVESDKDLPFPGLPPREQEKKGIAGALGKKQEAEVDPNDDLPF
jgi:single-strand DNA-binding protein